MAAIVTNDLRKDTKLHASLESGWDGERTVIINGLTGTKFQQLASAMALLPALGTAIDSSMPNCILRDITLKSNSPDMMTFVLKYSEKILSGSTQPTNDRPVITVGSSVTQIETNKDKDGNDIKVTYTFPATHKVYPGETDTKCKPVSILIPTTPTNIVIKRYLSPLQIDNLSLQYSGKLNSDYWFGRPPQTCMCTGIRASGQYDYYGGIDVTYSFEYRRPRTGETYPWRPEARYTDPTTGDPPGDIDSYPNAIKSVDSYDTADFDWLNLEDYLT